MAELKIYLKNKNDISTPDALNLHDGNIFNLKSRSAIESHGFTAIDGNIYFYILIDSVANYDSGNYDYYLYVENDASLMNPNTPIVVGSTDDDIDVGEGVILKKINSDPFFVKDEKGSRGYWIEVEKGIGFGGDDTDINLVFSLLKTLKDRPLRNKGIVEFQTGNRPIDDVIYKA